MVKKKLGNFMDKNYQAYIILVLLLGLFFLGAVVLNSDKILSQQKDNIAGKGFLDRLKAASQSQQEDDPPPPADVEENSDLGRGGCEGVQENEVEDKVLDILEAYNFVRQGPGKSEFLTEEIFDNKLLEILERENYINEITPLFISSNDFWGDRDLDCSLKCEFNNKKCLFTIAGRSIGDNDQVNYDKDRLTYLGLCSEKLQPGVSSYRQWCICSN
jgi:hypothetical protein